jgi:hypothetical protein
MRSPFIVWFSNHFAENLYIFEHDKTAAEYGFFFWERLAIRFLDLTLQFYPLSLHRVFRVAVSASPQYPDHRLSPYQLLFYL